MGITIQRGSGPNLAVRNPLETVYLRGDEFTDDSVRLIVGDAEIDVPRMERRANGVWNLTEFELSTTTLLIGRELALSAAGSLLQTEAVEFGERFLMPAIPRSDAGTTHPFTPTLSAKTIGFPEEPDDSAELIQTVHEYDQFTGPDFTLIDRLTFKTGSVGSSAPVVFKISQPGESGQVIYFRRILPANFFVANTDAVIDLPGVESRNDVAVRVTLESDNPFALKYDAAQTSPARTVDFFVTVNKSMPTVSSPMFDNDGALMSMNDGEMLLEERA